MTDALLALQGRYTRLLARHAETTEEHAECQRGVADAALAYAAALRDHHNIRARRAELVEATEYLESVTSLLAKAEAQMAVCAAEMMTAAQSR